MNSPVRMSPSPIRQIRSAVIRNCLCHGSTLLANGTFYRRIWFAYERQRAMKARQISDENCETQLTIFRNTGPMILKRKTESV